MNVAKTLRDAAKYIRVHGWTQGNYRDSSGRVCMIGACRAVLRIGHAYPRREIYNALGPVTGLSVVEFNDVHCESKRDAIAALEIAADIAECEGK